MSGVRSVGGGATSANTAPPDADETAGAGSATVTKGLEGLAGPMPQRARGGGAQPQAPEPPRGGAPTTPAQAVAAAKGAALGELRAVLGLDDTRPLPAAFFHEIGQRLAARVGHGTAIVSVLARVKTEDVHRYAWEAAKRAGLQGDAASEAVARIEAGLSRTLMVNMDGAVRAHARTRLRGAVAQIDERIASGAGTPGERASWIARRDEMGEARRGLPSAGANDHRMRRMYTDFAPLAREVASAVGMSQIAIDGRRSGTSFAADAVGAALHGRTANVERDHLIAYGLALAASAGAIGVAAAGSHALMHFAAHAAIHGAAEAVTEGTVAIAGNQLDERNERVVDALLREDRRRR